MRKICTFFTIIVLCFIGLQSVSVAQQYLVPIYVQLGPVNDTLWIGVNSLATPGIDQALGEYDLGPAPPEGFCDVRLVNPYGNQALVPNGLHKDIRPFLEACQTDTFKIDVQPCSDADSISFSWPDLSAIGCDLPLWRFTTDLGATPAFDIDMMHQRRITFNDPYRFLTFYIRKADGHLFRTFSMETLAKDGITDSRGKKTYGAAVRARSNMVEFCVEFVNNERLPVNGLRVEFTAPVEIVSITYTGFRTSLPYYGAYLSQKWDFMDGTIDSGTTVTICGYGVKPGVRAQAIKMWYWSKDGIVHGKRKRYGSFSKNIVRLPMPNTVNAGREMMEQIYPERNDILVVGTTDREDSAKYIFHQNYTDVLKTLIVYPGKVGKEKLHDMNVSYLNNLDHARFGFRSGKPIYKPIKALSPARHQNRLLGQALTLSINVKFSETQKVPPGLGQMQINLPASPFHTKSLDELLAMANHYLTWGSIATDPSIDALDLADMCEQVNDAFEGTLDTTSWGGEQTKFSGCVPVGRVGWLHRIPGIAPKIIPRLAATTGTTPLQYTLEQNYPNPFNPATTINFALPDDGLVTIKIINLLGQEISTLVQQEEFAAGNNHVEFNAANLPSGVYFYRIHVTDITNGETVFRDTKKMALVK